MTRDSSRLWTFIIIANWQRRYKAEKKESSIWIIRYWFKYLLILKRNCLSLICEDNAMNKVWESGELLDV